MDELKKCKIVVFGAFGAGKTTLIRTLDPASKHVEAPCAGGTTTVALDFGHIQLDGCEVHIYGTPGQERFEFAREIIGKGMDGAILLVDATAPIGSFTHHVFDSLTAARVPFVIFLNRYNSAGAKAGTVREQFPSVQIWNISALDKQQSLELLGRFVGTLALSPGGHCHHH